MTLTLTVLGASLACYILKLLGYLAPQRWLASSRLHRIVGQVTVALLAALVAVQTLGVRHGLAVDARLAGLAVAAVALILRAPFLLVVVLAASTAAALRALHIG